MLPKIKALHGCIFSSFFKADCIRRQHYKAFFRQYRKGLIPQFCKDRPGNTGILFEPEIPGNTGNIMRTCVATGTRLHLIEPLGFKLDESSIKRSGVNYIDKLEYAVYKNWDDFKEKNQGTYYFFTRYGHKTCDSFDFSLPFEDYYVMFGKESSGIPRELLKDNLDRCIRIPMLPNARSLNLSNSVAIILYEMLRQQEYYGLASDENIKGTTWLEDNF